MCRIGSTSIFASEPGLDGLGGRLREFRRRRGLTLDDVASRSGITLGSLSQIERGLTVPPRPTLARVAAQLDIPIARLLQSDAVSPYGSVSHGERRRFADLEEHLVPKQLNSTDLTVHPGDEFAIVLYGEVDNEG